LHYEDKEKGKERVDELYDVDLNASDDEPTREDSPSECSVERLHFLCDDEYPAADMILNVIRAAEIAHLTALIKGYHINKSTIISRINERKRKSKRNRNDATDVQYVFIAKVAIPETDLNLPLDGTVSGIATVMWESSIFPQYGTIVKRWSLYVKRVLTKYTPDEYWKMLCFFTGDRFTREQSSVGALDDYHPWKNKSQWEDKVPRCGVRTDMKELYGIIGVYLRERICSRPDIYLTEEKKYGLNTV